MKKSSIVKSEFRLDGAISIIAEIIKEMGFFDASKGEIDCIDEKLHSEFPSMRDFEVLTFEDEPFSSGLYIIYMNFLCSYGDSLKFASKLIKMYNLEKNSSIGILIKTSHNDILWHCDVDKSSKKEILNELESTQFDNGEEEAEFEEKMKRIIKAEQIQVADWRKTHKPLKDQLIEAILSKEV